MKEAAFFFFSFCGVISLLTPASCYCCCVTTQHTAGHAPRNPQEIPRGDTQMIEIKHPTRSCCFFYIHKICVLLWLLLLENKTENAHRRRHTGVNIKTEHVGAQCTEFGWVYFLSRRLSTYQIFLLYLTSSLLPSLLACLLPSSCTRQRRVGG